jgi:Methyltransferase domain
MSIPIKPIQGVTLQAGPVVGIARVIASDHSAKKELSWDRYVRLNAVAELVLGTQSNNVLDAGGYDGALALFLPGLTIDLIDPATTGGSVLKIPASDGSYDTVVAIDVLEHIEPKDRAQALCELARIARRHVILNYPCRDSQAAQKLTLKLTNDALIREHVQWELPDSDWVLSELATHGFSGTVKPHSSIAVWLSQYLVLNLVPEAAKELSMHLVENYADEPFSKPLYHLVHCSRA